MMRRWNIGLSAWIVQDGNYGDFERGQTAEFAVEFWVRGQLEPAARAPTARPNGDAYDIVGAVGPVVPEAWALDCGIPVFQTGAPPAGVAPGDVVAGTVEFGVDPFDYFERLARIDAMPPLVLSWRIESIRRRTADGWAATDRTDAWRDDDHGVAEYSFECVLLDVPPKRSSATATP